MSFFHTNNKNKQFHINQGIIEKNIKIPKSKKKTFFVLIREKMGKSNFSLPKKTKNILELEIANGKRRTVFIKSGSDWQPSR